MENLCFKHAVALSGAALMLFVVTACSSQLKHAAVESHSAVRTVSSLEQEYRIQPGDLLDIKFYYSSELNEQITVRPDGRISLQLVGEIAAAGMSPGELTKVLKEKYVDLDGSEIAVIVRSFNGQRVFVDGEVNRAGIVNMIGPLTVMDAISQVGGVKESARLNEIVVIHRNGQKKSTVTVVDLEKVLDGTDLSQDIYLKSFDMIYVPKSSIANVDQWVDQYFKKVIPFPVGLGASIF